MRLTSKILSSILIILVVGQSCGDGVIWPYNYQSIWSCHHKTNLNLEATQAKVIGQWEWKYIKCCGETANPYENNTEFKNLKIEFKNDGTGTLMHNEVISDFTWTIGTYSNMFSFVITPYISQVDGQLLFCDDIMMCNASYKDGADNFFKKTN